jgi:hypothetical protein
MEFAMPAALRVMSATQSAMPKICLKLKAQSSKLKAQSSKLKAQSSKN